MHISELFTNARLAASTVVEHLGDDPVLLGFQILQRMPTKVRTVAAKALAAVPEKVSPAASAIGLAVEGDVSTVKQRAQEELTGQMRPDVLLSYASILLHSGHQDEAEEVLSKTVPLGRRYAQTQARFQWYRGEMSQAVETLQALENPGASLGRLSSELNSFQGARPKLSTVEGYEPRDKTAVFLLTNSLPETGSGYAQRSHSILTHLKAEGWDVSAVTRLGWPILTGSVLAPHRRHMDGIDYIRLIPHQTADGFDARLQQQAEMLLEVVKDKRPAVLHTTTHWVNALVTQAVADAVGIPWVYEVRGQLADTWASKRGAEALESERYKLFRTREAEAAQQADAVVTLGEMMKEELVAQGIGAQKISICGNAVGDTFLEEPRPATGVRPELGLEPDLNYIGTVSSIVGYEGLDTVVRALAELAPEYPELRLLIAGDGEALPGLLSLADELEVTDQVIAPGRVPREKARLYHQALDIFLVPRIDSSVTRSVTPMKSVEASATARPVIASDLPALRELVQHEKTGLLAPSGDVEAWARAIAELLNHPEYREQLGEQARVWALENRTWAANTQTYLQVYENILKEDSLA